jgi:hypothetical protein
MGFFSDLFGGVDDSAQDATIEQNRQNFEYIKQQSQEAKDSAWQLYPAASEARRSGYQDVIDLLAGIVPQQIGLVQQGRQNQQNTIMGGQDAMIAALMGNPVDMSSMYSAPLSVDTSMFNRQLPASTFPTKQTAQPVMDYRTLLSGRIV